MRLHVTVYVLKSPRHRLRVKKTFARSLVARSKVNNKLLPVISNYETICRTLYIESIYLYIMPMEIPLYPFSFQLASSKGVHERDETTYCSHICTYSIAASNFKYIKL